MTRPFTVPLRDSRTAQVRFTDRTDGDLSVRGHVAPDDLARRRSAITDHPWVWLNQVHGPEVIIVDGESTASGQSADASVTTASNVALAVHAADCTPLALVASEGVIAVAHAGWKGMAAGVIEATAERMRDLGATSIQAWAGPVICPEHYEFGENDLGVVVDALGSDVRSLSEHGTPALDLWTGLRQAVDRAGVDLVVGPLACTATDDRYFSHRARAEPGRHAVVAWIEPDVGEPGA